MAGGALTTFRMIPTRHPYPFDPTYGHSLDDLLAVGCPEEPSDFADFWRGAYAAAMAVPPKARVIDTGYTEKGWRLYDVYYTSTDAMKIGGWMVVPESGPLRRGFVVGHGYGGREGGDFHYPLPESAIIFPCCRGMARSLNPPISPEAQWHVLHDIDKPDRYVIRGCVEDTWLAFTVLLNLFPQIEGHLGYLGGSFGGGVGALALPWDDRVQRAHLRVPTFGNQPLRLELPNVGSGASVINFARKHPEMVRRTLQYYDAAVAARHINIPVHCACALFDPSVAPPGQFAVYNALAGPKELYVLDAGHHPFEGEDQQNIEVLDEIEAFFRDL